MSTMVCGWLLCFFGLLIPMSVLMFEPLYETLWNYRIVLLVFALTKAVLVLLRSVVADALLNDNGEITWPITFGCVWVVLIVINFAIGILAAVARFFLLL